MYIILAHSQKKKLRNLLQKLFPANVFFVHSNICKHFYKYVENLLIQHNRKINNFCKMFSVYQPRRRGE